MVLLLVLLLLCNRFKYLVLVLKLNLLNFFFLVNKIYVDVLLFIIEFVGFIYCFKNVFVGFFLKLCLVEKVYLEYVVLKLIVVISK